MLCRRTVVCRFWLPHRSAGQGQQNAAILQGAQVVAALLAQWLAWSQLVEQMFESVWCLAILQPVGHGLLEVM